MIDEHEYSLCIKIRTNNLRVKAFKKLINNTLNKFEMAQNVNAFWFPKLKAHIEHAKVQLIMYFLIISQYN
jgi:hypothetical protein